MKNNFAFVLICAGILAVSISNLWRLSLFPFPDLPNHLAEAYLFRQLSDPASGLHQYYRLLVSPLDTATLYVYFCALFTDVELGSRIFYTLYLLILPASLLLLVREAQGNRWVALLALLFVYNFSMLQGFSTFSMGIAVALLDMLVLVKFLTRPSVGWAFLLALTSVLLFYAHGLILAFAGAVSFIAILVRREWPVRTRLLGLAALLPAGLLAFAWLLRFQASGPDQPLLPFLTSYYRQEYLPTLVNRLTGLLSDNKAIAPRPAGHLLALLFTAPPAAGFLVFAARNRFKQLLPAGNPSQLVALIFFAAAGLAYCLLPDHLPGWWFLYQRFSVFICLGMIWLLSVLVPPGFARPAQILTVLLVCVHAALWFQYFSAFDRLARPFRSLLYHAPQARERTLAAVIDDYDFRGSPVFIHYQDYQLIWNGGAVPTAITDYRFRLVDRQPGLPPYQEWVHNESLSNLVNNYANQALMLAHGQAPLDYLSQDGRYILLDRRGDWALFEKRNGAH